MRPSAGVALLILVTSVAAGCAAARPRNRFVASSGSGPVEVMERLPGRVEAPSRKAIAQAAAEARERHAPAPRPRTAETENPALRAALARAERTPTADALCVVASEYRAVGVLDRAMDFYDAALASDRRHAAAYDGRARIWRDWGTLDLALVDASRAVYFAPRSPEIRNTLGTVLLGLGDVRAAKTCFAEALRLDPDATYAADNLRLVQYRLNASANDRPPEHGERKP